MCMHEVWNTCSSVSKVDVSWLSAFKMNTIEISWSVKGYHYVYILHKDLKLYMGYLKPGFENLCLGLARYQYSGRQAL